MNISITVISYFQSTGFYFLNRLSYIKGVRAITSLGLKEAKDLVDGAPKPVKEAIPKKEAEEIKAKLEAVGAEVELT